MNPSSTEAPVAIVAGGGAMPLRVAAACRATGRPYVAVLLEGFARPEEWRGVPQITIRLGAAGAGIEWMRRQGAHQIVLVGDIRRPSILSLRPDAGAAKHLARIGMKAFNGDDTLLSARCCGRRASTQAARRASWPRRRRPRDC
jgi:DUF1009 family protein